MTWGITQITQVDKTTSAVDITRVVELHRQFCFFLDPGIILCKWLVDVLQTARNSNAVSFEESRFHRDCFTHSMTDTDKIDVLQNPCFLLLPRELAVFEKCNHHKTGWHRNGSLFTRRPSLKFHCHPAVTGCIRFRCIVNLLPFPRQALGFWLDDLTELFRLDDCTGRDYCKQVCSTAG